MRHRGLENLGDRIQNQVYDRLEKNFTAAGIDFDEYRPHKNSSDEMPWNTHIDLVGGGKNPAMQINAGEVQPANNGLPLAKVSGTGKALKKPVSNVPPTEVSKPVYGLQKDTGPKSALPDDPSEPPYIIDKNVSHLKSMGEAVDRWDSQIIEAASKYGVPPEQLKAMVWIETGGAGNPDAVQINPTYGNTYGLTQINPAIWGTTAEELGYDLGTVEGQLGMGAYVLRKGFEEMRSWDGASSWFFNPSGTGDSVNGTTNNQYVARVHELMGY